MTIDSLQFRTISLPEQAETCIKFRADSFVVSFGSASKFHENDGQGAVRYLQWLSNLIQKNPLGCVHVWKEDRIIGQMEMRDAAVNSQTGYAHLFYLIPPFRGLGLGALLEEYSMSFFAKAGCQRAELSVSPTNLPAIKFYQKHGWENLGLRDGNASLQLMQKRYGTLEI